MMEKGIRLGWCGDKGACHKHGKEYIKPEYLGKMVKLNLSNRSDVVRFFMNIFLEREYTFRDISSISKFLKRKGLSRAERHAVIYKLGYRYSIPISAKNSMENLSINGYFCHRRYKELLAVRQTEEKP